MHLRNAWKNRSSKEIGLRFYKLDKLQSRVDSSSRSFSLAHKVLFLKILGTGERTGNPFVFQILEKGVTLKVCTNYSNHGLEYNVNLYVFICRI